MSGNAIEWCWDWLGDAYPTGGTLDPKGPITMQYHRVMRGGAFNEHFFDSGSFTVNGRGGDIPDDGDFGVYGYGFRCVQK